MNMPVRHNVGDKVVITDACIKRMSDSNRSTPTAGYPSDTFTNKAMDCKGINCTTCSRFSKSLGDCFGYRNTSVLAASTSH